MSDYKSSDQDINLVQSGIESKSSSQANTGFNSPALQEVDYKSWRDQFVLILLRSACVLAVVLILLSYPTSTNGTRIFFVILFSILLAITLLPVPYTLRAFSLVTIAYLIGVNSLFERGPFIDGSLFLLAAVVLAGLLLESKADILSLAIGIFTIIFFIILSQIYRVKPVAPSATLPSLTDWSGYLVNFSSIGLLLVFATRRYKGEFGQTADQAQKQFESLVYERSNLKQIIKEQSSRLEGKSLQLRSVTTIARAAATIQNMSELLDTVVNSSAEYFGYYHVGLYLLDEGRKNAFLQAASSTTGKQLVGESVRIKDDRQHIFNLAIEQGKAHLASDIGSGVFLADTNFPLTKSRLILPLSIRGDVVGILDFHSDQAQRIGQDDADALQPLADLVASLIDNKRLTDESNTLAGQLKAYTTSQIKETWSTFTSRNIPAYQYTPAGVRPLFSPAHHDATKDHLSIPLVLHGERIGNINLSRKGQQAGWTDKEREMVEKIADQIALALENSRLVDEAQKNAQRDQMIANISSRVRETLDVESVIRTAATEFRRVFDLKEVEISVGAPQAEPLRIRRNTSSLRLK